MKTIYQLQQIAARLREVTEVNSISPEDTFGLQADVLEYLADMEQNAECLGIHKVYASYAAMVADASAPVGSNGKALRFGQLVVIYDSNNTTQAESGNVYAWQKGNTGAAAWLLMGNLGSMHALQCQIDSLRSSDESLKGQLTELSEEKGKFDDDALYVSDTKGNLIATINANGIRTTDVEVKGGKVSQLFADILSKLDKEIDSDFFQIQDTNGNIAFRVDNRGVHLTKGDSWVVSVVLGDAYIPTSILRNEKGDVASAEIIFPDGQKGNIVITNQDANGVKGMTIGYNNKSIDVVIDRDSQGNVSKININ